MRDTNFIHTSVHLAGNDFWAKPFNLVYDILSQNIEYEDFLSVVNSISNILQELPQWDMGHEDPKAPWNFKDQFLWQGLKIIGEVNDYPALWEWIVNRITKKGKMTKNKGCLHATTPLPPTIPVGNSTFNEAVGASPGPGPGPGDSAALSLHVPVEDNAADDAANEGDTFISGILTPTQGPVGEDDHSGDGSTHSGPPSPSTPTSPIIPIDHRCDPSKSIHAPLPPETLPGAGSSASSSLITRQKVLPMYTSVYQGLGQYIAHGQVLDKYATILRNKFPAPEYETAITGYLEKLLTQPVEAFNTTKFQIHLNTLIS
ncbi:hypothetical protein DFH29DRAFT_881865 [Suillus ampliporus]|nr:hypothetical protein DFH29DRAFT_881865 [Suillus ampliporus]